jgi:hypothetical protein
MPWLEMDFPRPARDNGLGLHDDGVSGPGTMGRIYSLLDEMCDKNFHWITLLFNVATEKQALIRYALDRDIVPIIRPYEQHPHPRSRIPSWFVKACRDQGAVYFQVWNEPNLPEEHHKPYNEYSYGNITGHDAFVNLLLDQWLADAGTIRAQGGIPLFPPLAPTAYTSNDVFYHHRLYNDLLRIAGERGILQEAFEGAGLAIHNRPSGLPLDSTDRCSFNDYIWIEEAFLKKLGREIPLFGAEAGYESGMITTYLANVEGILDPPRDLCLLWHRSLNHEIFLRMNPSHPRAWKPYLICQNMWLSHDAAASWPGSGWTLNQWASGEAPAYKHMNDIAPFTRWKGAPPEPPPPPEPEPEPGDGDMDYDGLSEEMIAALGFLPAPSPTEPHWKVARIEVQPAVDHQSAFAVIPEGEEVQAIFSWPGEQFVAKPKPDPYAPVGARQWAASMPMYNAWGAYTVKLEGNSETISGFGLYGADLAIWKTAHRPVLIYFQWAPGEESPEPEPGSEPTPYSLKARLVDAPHGFQDLRGDIEAISDLARLEAEQRAFGDLGVIVIHHSGNEKPHTAMSLARWCVDQGDPTIRYHFVIDAEGMLYFTARLIWQTYHTYGRRKDGVAVTFLGDFTDQPPTQKALEAARFAITALWEFFGQGWGQCRPMALMPHFWVVNNSTACPGKAWRWLIWGDDQNPSVWPGLHSFF